MKIAITKIGANITFSSNNGSAANADILYALRTLKGFGHKFTVATQKTRNTELPDVITLLDIHKVKDFNSYDFVLVFNGSINFFGGNPDEGLFSLYRALSKTTKPIIFVQTDGALYFRQLWPLIKSREWASNLSGEEFEIDPNNVYYVSQGRKRDKTSIRIVTEKHSIIPRKIYHFPWEKTILANYEKLLTFPITPYEDRFYDLGFGGYIRNNHKKNRIEAYYDDPELNVLLFGNLRGINLSYSKVQPKISYQQMVQKMSECKATVIVGDKYYNDHFHTLRMYESILAGNLVLIDRMLDTKAFFYKGLENTNEYFVDSMEDVRHAIKNADTLIVSNIRDQIIRSFEEQGIKNRLHVLLEGICQDHR